jgi:hypothetical protein
MAKQLPPASPELNRLRAAAGLIPIIESGLADSSLTAERAAMMASFCEWTLDISLADVDSQKLIEGIRQGLERLKVLLAV